MFSLNFIHVDYSLYILHMIRNVLQFSRSLFGLLLVTNLVIVPTILAFFGFGLFFLSCAFVIEVVFQPVIVFIAPEV